MVLPSYRISAVCQSNTGFCKVGKGSGGSDLLRIGSTAQVVRARYNLGHGPRTALQSLASPSSVLPSHVGTQIVNGHLCPFAVFHRLLTQDRISPAPRVIVFEMEDIVRAVLVLCLLLFMGVETQAQPAPTIEYFTVDNHALDYPAVEAGVEAANFSWRVVGLREGDQMQMHALVGGQWRLIGAGFAPEKTDRLVIAHPLHFIPPTYRLSVVDAAGTPVAEHVLELSYAPPEGPPTVSMFLTFPPVEIIPLSAFDEPFHVQWRVSNRWFNSNLVFEQVLPDGTILNAEYSRPAEWQYALATGH